MESCNLDRGLSIKVLFHLISLFDIYLLGEWNADKKHGYAIETYPNTSKYEGKYLTL